MTILNEKTKQYLLLVINNYLSKNNKREYKTLDAAINKYREEFYYFSVLKKGHNYVVLTGQTYDYNKYKNEITKYINLGYKPY